MENSRKLTFIKWFCELCPEDHITVGGKGANLGKLYIAGFPVPRGFCITTKAFQQFAKEIDLETKVKNAISSSDISNLSQLNEASQLLRKYVLSHKIPVNISEEIVVAYHAMNSNAEEETWVAVRSSATSEDLPQASFAGQLESYLNLRGSQSLLTAVVNCWASLYTSRVIAYREKYSFSQTNLSIGVVVQEMVDATRSGVMFTVHPVTKEHNKMLIEATIGLGEALVSGAVTPDTFVVDKKTLEVLEKRIGTKKRIVLRNPVGGGVIRIKAQEPQDRKLSLTETEVQRIAEIGRRIESEFNNQPQDIEWAISEGNAYILQTRPITTNL